MDRLRRLSLQQKLVLIIMVTTWGTLLCVSGLFLIQDRRSYRRVIEANLKAQARIVANNSYWALYGDDESHGRDILRSLAVNPNIVGAFLIRTNGTLLAAYPISQARLPSARTEDARLEADRLSLFLPVSNEGAEPVGTLCLVSGLNELDQRLGVFAVHMLQAILAASLIALLLALRLQKVISTPLRELAQTARGIARDKSYAVRVNKAAEDELGHLIDCFNDMLTQVERRDLELEQARAALESRVAERTQELSEQVRAKERAHAALAEAQQRLMESSRQAGMAEMATGILHNIGNVLNSVSVSTTLLGDRFRQSKIVVLLQTIDLLRQQADPLHFMQHDPRGQQVPAFLFALAEHLQKERCGIQDELNLLLKHVDHIKGIVAMQQSYAKACGVRESVALAEVVEDALRMNSTSLQRHDIRIVRDYMDLPCLNIDKHKVLQILTNVIRNANFALKERLGADDKWLRINIAPNGAHGVRVDVQDNGVGIAPENLERIFSHGFTTRKDGHGFGLHMGALAAKEMGGSLTAFSAGLGQGATFTLEIPSHPTEG